MKKIIITSIFLVSVFTNAQILTNSVPATGVYGTNVFLDASTNYSAEAGEQNSIHKGIILPSANLTNFEFNLDLADGITFPSYFDGMIIYNNATGTTLTTGNRPAIATNVTPGYYYFSNPNGAANGNVTSGVWLPLGGGNSKVTVPDATTTPAGTATNVIVADGKEVYAVRGQFTTTANSTSVKLAVPTGITSLYRITIYKDGAVFGTNVHSYDKSNTTTNNAFTGAPGMSVVYPVGTYDYVLEYLK